MPDKKNTEKTIKKVKKQESEEKEVALDEKELLHEAEEREKERKEVEEAEKEEAKAEAREAKKEEIENKKAEKSTQRRKPRHGKKYRLINDKLERREYSIDEAIDSLDTISYTKFEGTVEIHIKLSKKLENVRGTFTLPGGAVKQKKVLEVTDKNVDEVVAKVKAGKIEFDVMVAEPKAMPKLAPLAKILGPKGLMPNPKSGTVSDDVKAAAEEFRVGRVEYKADKSNIVHLAIAKVKTDREIIKKNIEAILSQFPAPRIESIYLTVTMGPSLKITLK